MKTHLALLSVILVAVSIASPAQILTTLTSFDGSNGAVPESYLVQGTDGNFYGTTVAGGADNYGTVFKVTPSGTLTTLYSFCSQADCVDGDRPYSGLVQATDGNFYGETYFTGGDSGVGGTIFKITPSGTLTPLYSFCMQTCTDGGNPNGGVIQATDGNFYGTTSAGGINGGGTVFKITPSGVLTTLYSFCSQPNCIDGEEPNGRLVQATDGNFYGTTSLGGRNNVLAGTIFKITSAGALTTLHSFCAQANCADGQQPYAGLVQATDGNFYGVAPLGGLTGDDCSSDGCGSVFKITSQGAFTTLYNFCSRLNCGDGGAPEAALVQATDGNLYGTTAVGGTGVYGTVFQITTNGTLTTLYNFCSQTDCGDGGNPYATLAQAIDGNFYGTTSAGGSGSGGTVFRLSAGLDTIPWQFVAVTPCRLLDTRNGSPIQGGSYQSFVLPQLAQSQGCSNLATAAAYSLNVTLVPHNHDPVSYLTIWPAGKNQPTVSTMNSLDGRTKANAAIVPAGASGAVSVYATNTTDVVLDIDGYFATSGSSTLAFYPLPPCRVADTRESNFPQGLGTPHLSRGVARDFPVLASSCIPSGINAAAYSFNFTAIPYPALGNALAYLEVWPTGQQPQHPVSTLNNPTGTYVANAAIVSAGTDGKITAFASDNTDLAIDINGYFAPPGNGGMSLYPTLPCRVIDTRKIGNGQPFSGALTPAVDVVDSTCGVPNTAQAYTFNATVVPSPNLSYLTLWPDGQGQPVVSTLNAADGWVTSNMAIVPNINGSVDAYAAGMTQLILDISGYFAP